MKKAILVTGIIWAILCGLAAVGEILVAVSCFTPMDSGVISMDPNPLLGVANLIAAGVLLVATVLAIVLVAKRESNMKQVPGIVLGVVAAVLGATVPGVLFAIDSGMNRERE